MIDGSTNTIAYSEWLVGDGRGDSYGGQNPPSKYRGNMLIGAGGGYGGEQNALPNLLSKNSTLMAALNQCAAEFKTNNSNISDIKGLCWSMGTAGFSMFNTVQTPNDSQFRFGGCRNGCAGCWPDSSFTIGAASPHPGGANAMFADGSVKFVKDSIARNIWMSLGTRNGGEVVSSDSY